MDSCDLIMYMHTLIILSRAGACIRLIATHRKLQFLQTAPKAARLSVLPLPSTAHQW